MTVALVHSQHHRMHVVVHGAVQGVGFRPFVYRLATELGLAGWVCNAGQGVVLEVEGDADALQEFMRRLTADQPPRAVIRQVESTVLSSRGHQAFCIRPSVEQGTKTAVVAPDIATCSVCLHELFDPDDRRYLYPFINCTNCGPRYSIIETIPYDRAHTTMHRFAMCDHCQAEYDNPASRRFHAQPNACPECGPSLTLWDAAGVVLSTKHKALLQAAEAIRRGAIVAVKGLGGFHLMVNPRNDTAVQRLRHHKQRPDKPFALMYASLRAVQADCAVSEPEARLLGAPESPIVLLRHTASSSYAGVAPGNPYYGVMLPYTPLHHLLMHTLLAKANDNLKTNRPVSVIATSGNRADEPLCIDEHEALQRLGDIADLFLVHNRPIARPVDDSIVRFMLGRPCVLRRARGYAPLPIPWRPESTSTRATTPASILAVGAHLKNTIAFSVGNDIVVSQHIGDLGTTQAFAAWEETVAQLPTLYDTSPSTLVCDAHPDYLSSQGAAARNLPLHKVQHHYAHVLACMVDNALEPPLLGVAWDGSGYGLDGTIWGGEFLHVTETACTRVAHLRPFPLPGGARSIQEPRRTALGLLYALSGTEPCAMAGLAPVQAFTPRERRIVQQMLTARLNTPLTSSVGRLFDAFASLLGLRHVTTFEGQAAMELEFALEGVITDEVYPFRLETQTVPTVIDWSPLLEAILIDLQRQVPSACIAARFHNTLVEIIVAVAKHQTETQIVLTGGCFQNRYLTERAVTRLRAEGFQPFWHHWVPPNDGGIAVGQAAAVLRRLTQE